MQGFICLWSGTIANIPAGWHLCDGTMGTPDLRDKFIIGAGSTYGVGDTGGGNQTSLDTGNVIVQEAPNGAFMPTAPHQLPPYYALAFIMKL